MMHCVISVVFRYYGRKCLSHFVAAAEFEKTTMRTLNSQQWAKLKDAVETLRVKVQQPTLSLHSSSYVPRKCIYSLRKHTTHEHYVQVS